MTQSVNAGSLGIQITSSAELAIKAIRSLTSSINLATKATGRLTNAFKTLDTVSMSLNRATSSMTKISEGASSGAKSIKEFNKETKDSVKNSKESTKALQTMAGTFSSLKSSLLFSIGFGSLYQGLNTIGNFMKGSFQEASDYAENYNLFNVAFAGDTENAIMFQERLHNTMRINSSESMRYQGQFRNLAGALGITNEGADLLSQNLTQLTYDMASLHNTSFKLMQSKLKSGIVGQTKPLRDVGVDVTQQTLQPVLYDLGINKYVTELTQAEKVLLRYISIMRQTSSAQGDMGRTIEFPANQMRVFSDLVKELSRWFGTLYIGIVAKILPVLNGFLIVIKEIFRWTSMLLGFKVEDYDVWKASSEGVDDFSDGLEDALDNSEALKKSLAGFDEINNINEQTDGNMAFNTSGYSATYDTLLKEVEAMGDYTKGFDEIKMKANDIAKTLLEWLGYTTDTYGNITGIEGGFADIANLTFTEIKDFFSNLKLIVDDSMKWINDNPDAFKALTNLIVSGALIAGALWLVNNPLALIMTAIGFFIYHYDDIKNIWEGLTPDNQVATTLATLTASLLALAFAGAIAWNSLTGGGASLTIGAGMAVLGLAFGAIGLTMASNLDLLESQNTPLSSQRPDYNPYLNSGTGVVSGISNKSDVITSSSGEQAIILQLDGDVLARSTIKNINTVKKTTNLTILD